MQTICDFLPFKEYPYHLMCLEDGERLKTFLCAWDVFDVLYDREHSIQLLKYWEPVSSLQHS